MTRPRRKREGFLLISIHIPRVGDDTLTICPTCAVAGISIHIPRVGDDCERTGMLSDLVEFQSTSPVWGMTDALPDIIDAIVISIHIPRVGDDAF